MNSVLEQAARRARRARHVVQVALSVSLAATVLSAVSGAVAAAAITSVAWLACFVVYLRNRRREVLVLRSLSQS